MFVIVVQDAFQKCFSLENTLIYIYIYVFFFLHEHIKINEKTLKKASINDNDFLD